MHRLLTSLGIASSAAALAAVAAIALPAAADPDRSPAPPGTSQGPAEEKLDPNFTPQPGDPAPVTAPPQNYYLPGEAPHGPAHDRPVPGFVPPPGPAPSTVPNAPATSAEYRH